MTSEELRALIAKTERGLDQVLTAEGMAEIARDALRFRHIIKGARKMGEPNPHPGRFRLGWTQQWGTWCDGALDIRAAIDADMGATADD